MQPELRYGERREHISTPEIGLDMPFLYPRPRSSRNEKSVFIAADSPGSGRCWSSRVLNPSSDACGIASDWMFGNVRILEGASISDASMRRSLRAFQSSLDRKPRMTPLDGNSSNSTLFF